MITKHVIVTFDLIGTNDLYDEFYEKAKTKGLTKYIPARYINSNKDATLPNTTLFGVFSGSTAEDIRDNVRNIISSIYKEIKLQGTSIVVVSETWGIKSH